MIHRLQAHVLCEVLKTFAMSICVATFIMTIGVGVNEGIKQDVPFMVALQMLPFVVPETLRMTVPASLLFSVCSVYGRMASEQEWTAVKSLGITS